MILPWRWNIFFIRNKLDFKHYYLIICLFFYFGENNFMGKNFLKNYGVLLFFIGVFLFLYFLNAIFPTQSDDLGAELGGLTAAVNSYNNWNGRFGELLRVSFGSYLATTPFYAPMNALVGATVIFLVFLLVFARRPESTLKDISILSILIVFLLIDNSLCFGSFFYWDAGSFNYLWAWLLILLWILPYRFYWQGIITNKSDYMETNKIFKTIFFAFYRVYCRVVN